MNESFVRVLYVLAAVVIVVLAIYLTPLKWLNLVEPPMHEINATEFHEAYEANPDEYLFLDVRQQPIYEMAHAKGSVNQPIATFYDLRHAFPRTGKKIVLICTSGRLAAVAYGYLQEQGYTNLLHLEGGVQAWAAQGLPLEGDNLDAPLPAQD